MLELEKPDMLRLHHFTEEAEKEIRNVIQDFWSPGMESKEPEEIGDVKQYKLLESPWSRKESKSATSPNIGLATQQLMAKWLLAMNRKEQNLYARVTLGRFGTSQKTLLMFRSSNIGYTEALTLKLTGEKNLTCVVT